MPESLAKNFTSTSFRGVNDPKPGADGGQPPRKPLSSGAEFAGVGLQLGATIALSAWLGIWLDRRLESSPWLTILMVFVGAGAAFYSIYRRVMSGPRQ